MFKLLITTTTATNQNAIAMFNQFSSKIRVFFFHYQICRLFNVDFSPQKRDLAQCEHTHTQHIMIYDKILFQIPKQ